MACVGNGESTARTLTSAWIPVRLPVRTVKMLITLASSSSRRTSRTCAGRCPLPRRELRQTYLKWPRSPHAKQVRLRAGHRERSHLSAPRLSHPSGELTNGATVTSGVRKKREFDASSRHWLWGRISFQRYWRSSCLRSPAAPRPREFCACCCQMRCTGLPSCCASQSARSRSCEISTARSNVTESPSSSNFSRSRGHETPATNCSAKFSSKLQHAASSRSAKAKSEIDSPGSWSTLSEAVPLDADVDGGSEVTRQGLDGCVVYFGCIVSPPLLGGRCGECVENALAFCAEAMKGG